MKAGILPAAPRPSSDSSSIAALLTARCSGIDEVLRRDQTRYGAEGLAELLRFQRRRVCLHDLDRRTTRHDNKGRRGSSSNGSPAEDDAGGGVG